jgi:hypothetical protein
MRLFCCLAGGLLGLALCAGPGRAEAPPSPLRLVPEQADLLLQVKQPRRLVETLLNLDAVRQLEAFSSTREFLDSTNVRRFYQLLAYLEKELGAPWPELLDRLAGRGAVLAVHIGPNPAPSLLVVQGNDEKLAQKFFQVAVTLLEQEIARQEGGEKPQKAPYEGIPTVRLKADFHFAVAGTTLFVANSEKVLHAALDRQVGKNKKSVADLPGVAEAERLLPKDPLASVWLSLDPVHKAEQAKGLFQTPRDNAQLTVLVGQYLDLVGRSPFVCAGLYRDKDGLMTTIRMPRGREGMGAGETALHLPPVGRPGSRPLLEPRGVIYSDSNYLDLSRVWQDRDKLYNDKQKQGLEKFDKTSATFLSGMQLSKLLTQLGPYYRLVAVNQATVGYQSKPQQPIPAFAIVWEMRDPEEFSRSMGTVLRGAAFAAGRQAKLKLAEEEHKGCKIVGYRFPEGVPLKGDVNDIRYNFSPCFVRVGDQFVVSSTIELGRELVDLLQKEGTTPERGKPNPTRGRLYASGGAAYLELIQDTLLVQTILDQALTPQEAREQVKAFLAYVRRLGTLDLQANYDSKDFHYDIRLNLNK